MPISDKKFYEFGEFRLDPSERLLQREGETVHLQPRVFDTLLALIENSGHLVKKDDLLKTVWSDSIVEENNLTQNIYALRKAFDEAGGKNYIETIPRHGYRFTGEVREIYEETEVSFVENRSLLHFKIKENIEESPPAGHFSRNGKLAAAVLMILAASGVFLVWNFALQKSEKKSIIITADIKTLAVLPFQIEKPAPSDEFLGLVIADDLSRLVMHSASFKFRFPTPGSRVLENQTDAQTLGKLLKADAVLTGVVSKNGETLKIRINLIKTADGTVLWNQLFINRSGDIFQLNDSIAEAFLKDYPPDEEDDSARQTHRPKSPEAYKNFIKGRALWNKRTSSELHQSTLLLEQAIAQDPNFALAYAALADAYAFDFTQRFKAVETAEKALELNPKSGEAHASLGFFYLFWDWNIIEAERHFKQAAALSPHYATGHQWYAALFAASGMMSAAKQQIQTALELEPISLPIKTDSGQILYFADEYDKALDSCSTAIAFDPEFINAYGCLYQIYSVKKMYSEAVSAYLKREEISGIKRKNVTDRNANLKQAFDSEGIEGFWREMLTPLWETQGDLKRAEYNARLGNHEEVFRLLEISFKNREFGFLYTAVNPVFENYRYDPRFRQLIAPFDLVAQKSNK